MWIGLFNCLADTGIPNAVAANPLDLDTISQFKAQLGKLLTYLSNTTFIIFVDEFDNIVHQCMNLEYDKIMGLLRHIVEATDFPIIFFISVLQDLPDSYGSPLPSDTIVLHPFDRADSDKIVVDLLDGYANLTNECLDWLYEYTGGHPYFIKLFLMKLLDLLDEAKPVVSLEILQTVAQTAYESTHADEVLRAIYSKYLNDDERYILLWLASRETGTLPSQAVRTAKTQLRSACKRLVRRDFVLQKADDNYTLRMDFLGDWLRNWSEFETEIERLQVPEDHLRSHATILPSAIIPHGICIDLGTQRVYVDGREMEDNLSEREYRALIYLAQRSGQVVSKDDFASYVWQEEYFVEDDQRISALVYRLRDALKDKHRPYRYLETLSKRGFRLQQTTLIQASS
jgi:DNA-binding winged helix-turn-helix (wHTH) protein